MFGEKLENVRKKSPLIHNITNYVTANDCANILLACGASPIMADDPGEAEEITSLCDGLNINMGTLNQGKIPTMFATGKKANELNIPVILDPVGVGASKLRMKIAMELMDVIKFTAIRGNLSEIKALALGEGISRGVDVGIGDRISKENLSVVAEFVKGFAKQTGLIIAITGEIDIVADEKMAYCIYNGHPMMRKVTGAGCQLSALTTAFAASNLTNRFEAVAAAVGMMGVCGEKAFERLEKCDGNATYRNYIIDAVFNLKAYELDKCLRFEII